MPLNSYSEYQEDFWIMSNLPLPKHGFYLDIGCGDPVHNSNTAFLRDHGWQGIGVDGNPNLVHRWNEVNAPFISCVIAERTGCIGFRIDEKEPAMSRIDDAAQGTYCRTLENLLTQRFQIGKIDFLSIDVEGAEFDVLREMDFQKHQPSVIVAEYSTLQNDVTVKEDMRVRDMLIGNGAYKMVHKTVANMIYALV